MEDELIVVKQITNAQWQANVAQGGCFLFAEATVNRDVQSIAESINRVPLEYCRLYTGETGRIHASISPYLIYLDEDNQAQLEADICYQHEWGIALQLRPVMTAFTPLQQIHLILEHLREWSWIAIQNPDPNNTPEQNQLILRLGCWDVLIALLKASTVDETASLFDMLESFYDIRDGVITQVSLHTFHPRTLPNRIPQQLSETQWVAITEHNHLQRYQDYATHLREHHAQLASWDDEDLSSFIHQHVQAAKTYGFNNAKNQIKYLSLVVTFDGPFMHNQWATQAMEKPVVGIYSQMDVLYQAAEKQLT
jgi:hypothetical protein